MDAHAQSRPLSERPPHENSTRIAVASGKGGTGKTTVATNLALLLARREMDVELLDCDVEEPNCHIFLHPQIDSSEAATIPVPHVDPVACTNCGVCADVCEFGAIACLKADVLVFAELCHGCGGCSLLCPEGAITEVGREIGTIEIGLAEGLRVVQGRLRVGEALSPPLIRAVKDASIGADVVLADVPPGTACPAVEAVRGSDLVVLVTEPTPFGTNDLKLAVGMLRAAGLALGVVINRCDIGDSEVEDYCAAERLPVLARIPDDRRLAEAYSRGRMALDAVPGYEGIFDDLWEQMNSLAMTCSRNRTGSRGWSSRALQRPASPAS